MDSYLLPGAAAPCTDCLITFMQADLEYPDGSYANADTGMWLHHAVLVNLNEPDAVCASEPNRIFASGNERTAADISNNGYVPLLIFSQGESKLTNTPLEPQKQASTFPPTPPSSSSPNS
jgi:hypothetical protein